MSPREKELVGFAPGGAQSAPVPIPPTQARGLEKRDRLYEITISRFVRDGIDATRIEDVVAEAGVSWATFFRYFPRKEDVLIEAGARHFRDHVRAPARLAIGDRRRRVRTVVEATFGALTTANELPPAVHSATLMQVLAHPARFAAMVADGGPQPLISFIAELIAVGQERGEIRDDVPAQAIAVTVTAGSFFPATQAASLGADTKPAIRLALDLIWGGIAGDATRSRS